MSIFIKIFIVSIFFFLLTCLTIIFKNKLERFSSNYNTIQKIHTDYVPPFGGMIIFISFYLYTYIFFDSASFFNNFSVLIPSIVIITIGLLEDIFNNIKHWFRLIIIFLSSLLYCFYNSELPSVEFWIIGDLINSNFIIQILFFSICLTALSNGFNMLDGMNGLTGFTSLCIGISIFSLIEIYNFNFFEKEILLVLLILILQFLFFNFPFGKIFLGDSGAYWLGWINGIMILEIFRSNFLNSWCAVLILFYPSMEVIFSTMRKLTSGTNPFLPDINHLHLKLYYLLKGPIRRSSRFNSFTTVCLMPFWFSPPFLFTTIQFKIEFAYLWLTLFVVLYLLFYYLIPKKDFK